MRRGVVPDVLTDQTSAHDALNGYVPAGLSLEQAVVLRESDPKEYVRRSMESMATPTLPTSPSDNIWSLS